MTTAMTAHEPVTVSDLDPAVLESLIVNGDCSKLNPQQRVAYYRARCDAAKVDYRSQPFQFIMLNGKLVMYALKSCTDQLAANNGIVCEITDQRTEAGIRTVTVRSRTKDGRQTDEVGCVSVAGKQGDDLCNAYLKAVTKAKRRAVLSLCGLGMIDELELETIPHSAKVSLTDTTRPALPPAPEISVAAETQAKETVYEMKPPVARAAAKTKADLEKQMEAALAKDAPAVEPPKVKAPPTPAKGTWGTYYVILHYPPEGKGPHKMKLHTAPSASREEGLYPCSLWAAPKDVPPAVASRRVKIIEYAKANGVAIKCCVEEGKPYNDKPQWTITDVQEPEAPDDGAEPDNTELF